jgi:diguanylate cyclase (GGDEF)-like protein/PAS domain S-box-containing protein
MIKSLPVREEQPEGRSRAGGSSAPAAERGRARERRREDPESQRRALFYRAIIDASAQALIVVSADGTIQCWSRGAEELFGFSEQEMNNRPIRSFWEGAIDPASFSVPAACCWDTDKRLRDGTVRHLSVESSPLCGPDGQLVAAVWMVRDISERLRQECEQREREAGLREDARTDPLTHVINRRGLLEALQAEYSRGGREGTPLTLVFADLDDFKSINDDFGHSVGDLVLQAFAALIQSHLRAYDLMARWGGDEFVIMMPNTSRDEAAACIERIREVVQRAKLPCLPRRLTASFGISEHWPGEALESQLCRTDQALYRAKHGGKNCAAHDDNPVRQPELIAGYGPDQDHYQVPTGDVAPSPLRIGDGKRRA